MITIFETIIIGILTLIVYLVGNALIKTFFNQNKNKHGK